MTGVYHTSGNECGVSPVIGVMLMIVVVVIIAAVVSGFAGSMIGTNNGKPPSLIMDVKIVNMGSWTGSGFFATVSSVSEPIPTNDLKIVTSWKTKKRYYNQMTAGNYKEIPISGGNTTLPGRQNILVLANPDTPLDSLYVAPFGAGAGVNWSGGTSNTNALSYSAPGQQFGKYTLMSGTIMAAMPCGAGSIDEIGGMRGTSAEYGYGVGEADSDIYGAGVYTTYKYTGGPYLDPVTAVLGTDWEWLRSGDTVNVKIIHIPTGKVIFQQDIQVMAG